MSIGDPPPGVSPPPSSREATVVPGGGDGRGRVPPAVPALGIERAAGGGRRAACGRRAGRDARRRVEGVLPAVLPVDLGAVHGSRRLGGQGPHDRAAGETDAAGIAGRDPDPIASARRVAGMPAVSARSIGTGPRVRRGGLAGRPGGIVDGGNAGGPLRIPPVPRSGHLGDAIRPRSGEMP